VQHALDLLDAGTTRSEVAKLIGVNRSTIRGWDIGRARALARPEVCHICHRAPLAERPYAYVLGLYLGDGCISVTPNGVAKMRITQTAIYVGLIREAKEALAQVLPNRVGTVRKIGCVEITSHSKHWTCLIPQHGPGRKHERLIELVDWQVAVVERETPTFLRGLIHSDGCRAINTIKARGRVYRYPRYQFTNASVDIMRMFTDACDRMDIHWTRLGPRDVAVSRRGDVARLDEFIGPKSLPGSQCGRATAMAALVPTPARTTPTSQNGPACRQFV
jgi:hypothetical protein